MKRLVFIGTLLLIGCSGRSAVVISSDGTTELGYCGATPLDSIPVCVGTICPDGSYTLKAADKYNGDAVIRCLPANK